MVLRRLPPKEEVVEQIKNEQLLARNSKEKREIKIKEKERLETAELIDLTPEKFQEKISRLISHGEYKKAEKILIKMVSMYPRRGMYFALLGDVYSGGNNFADALSAYREAAKRDPENGFLLCSLAEVYFKLKNYKDAAFYFDKSLFFNNKIAKRHAGLGNAYFKLNKLRLAERCFEQALSLEHHNSIYKRSLYKTRKLLDSHRKIKLLER